MFNIENSPGSELALNISNQIHKALTKRLRSYAASVTERSGIASFERTLGSNTDVNKWYCDTLLLAKAQVSAKNLFLQATVEGLQVPGHLLMGICRELLTTPCFTIVVWDSATASIGWQELTQSCAINRVPVHIDQHIDVQTPHLTDSAIEGYIDLCRELHQAALVRESYAKLTRSLPVFLKG